MKKEWIKVGLLQVIFFVIASSYIPLNVATDAYLMKHRENRCLIEEPVCSYDTKFATSLDAWRIESQNIAILPANWAPKYSYTISAGNLGSYIADFIVIVFWMIVLNTFFFIGRGVLKIGTRVSLNLKVL